MKKIKLLFMFVLSLTIAGCSSLLAEQKIKENHFRFENFKRNVATPFESVYLMCAAKKVTGWNNPKQYLSGEHDLWVKYSLTNPNMPNRSKEAFVNFKVSLGPGKSYMLNRELQEDIVSVWIQEVDTGLRVSEVINQELERVKTPYQDKFLHQSRCQSGSI